MTQPFLLLTPNFPPTVGGISTMLGEISKQLPVDNFVVVAPEAKYCQQYDQSVHFKVYRTKAITISCGLICKIMARLIGNYSFLMLAWLRILPKLKRIAQKHRTETFVLGHMVMGLTALALVKWIGGNYVIIVYGNEIIGPLENKNWVECSLYKLVYKHSAAIIVTSDFTRNLVLRWGVADNKIHKVRPGVDPILFNPKADIIQLLNQFDLVEQKLILTIGRLVERKGHDIVIKALLQILPVVPNVKYIIVGTGEMEQQLRKLARNLQVEDHVIFAGYVPDEELPQYYCAADLLVMVARQTPGSVEGFGIVYLEANACEKPVIAGNVGGAVDAVMDGVTGITVDPENVEAVAAAIIKLLTNPHYAKKLGRQGRQRVENELNWQVTSDNFQKVLTDVEQRK